MTTGTPATLAAKRATTTIPIVMTAVNDPVADGLVASLAKPGGNVTGNAVLQPELTAKQLELLKEVAPSASRIAMLAHDDAPGLAVLWKASEERAARLGLKLERVDVRRSADFDVAFGAIVRSRVDALLAVADPLVYLHIARIADFALKQRLPTIAFFSEFVPAGGLLAYGPSLSSLTRRATLYVDKILKGARPGDLPVEQPTKFELAINLKSAKALGITCSARTRWFSENELQSVAVLEPETAPQVNRRNHLQHVVAVPRDVGNDDRRRDVPRQGDRNEPPAACFGR